MLLRNKEMGGNSDEVGAKVFCQLLVGDEISFLYKIKSFDKKNFVQVSCYCNNVLCNNYIFLLSLFESTWQFKNQITLNKSLLSEFHYKISVEINPEKVCQRSVYIKRGENTINPFILVFTREKCIIIYYEIFSLE